MSVFELQAPTRDAVIERASDQTVPQPLDQPVYQYARVVLRDGRQKLV